jgi:uncharacterized membrane protein YfcA
MPKPGALSVVRSHACFKFQACLLSRLALDRASHTQPEKARRATHSHSVMLFDTAMLGFGLLVGAIGTMVGVGGGFILVPVIALLEPHWEARTITAYSLAVVSANACSGTVAYLRARRVDLPSAGAFIVAAFPGVFAGVAGADRISRGWFDPLFGILLALMAAVLTFAPGWRSGVRGGPSKRTLVDANGNNYAWSFDMRLGLIGSVFVGIVSALFGIGGGPIQVPFLVTVLNFPEHVATATSHAVLAATSLLATLIHATNGDFAADLPVTIATAVGALIGAPIGARLSQIVSGRVLLRILAAMLVFIAARLIFFSGDSGLSHKPK